MTKSKYAMAIGLMAACIGALATPLCNDGVPLKPDPKYAAAKMPKLPPGQPVPTCGMTPCTAQQLAAGPVKCTTEHFKPLPAPKGQPTKYTRSTIDTDED